MYRNWSKAFRQGNAVYQLNMLANATIQSVEGGFVGIVGLDIRTIRVLRLIGDNPGITFAEITTLGALERSLASRLIQLLVRKALVERRNDETDARRFGLYITPAGQEARGRADLISDKGLDLIFRNLTPAEAATFVRIMGTLADWIDSDEFEQESRTMFAELTQKLGRP